MSTLAISPSTALSFSALCDTYVAEFDTLKASVVTVSTAKSSEARKAVIGVCIECVVSRNHALSGLR